MIKLRLLKDFHFYGNLAKKGDTIEADSESEDNYHLIVGHGMWMDIPKTDAEEVEMKDWMESKELRTIVKLYVDDVREAPDPTWNVERTFHGAISFLEKHNVHVISLDHDLGCFYGNREMTGFDILNWLVARKMDGAEYPEVVRVHSANPAVHDQMKLMIEKYWGEEVEKGYSENDFSSSGC